jgi:asparagine synthase (glutamine-hydrolysing)
MCGISGIVGKKSEQYSNAMHAMAQALHHRGPDGSAVYFFENCALGHNRLSIVDLATGEQPMITPDKNRGIVFNGEIYGYKEIKEALQKEFHFKTASDTEVILALYQKYGEKLPEHLPGMFAFAIWDDEKQKLFCARDRFGEKPFYYAWGEGGEFIFASEIKAILATGLVKPVIDRGSLVHYLRHLYVEPGKSIYKNIFVLPPAHYLIAHNGDVVVGRYWQLPVVDEKIGVDEAVDKFKILLKQAVERQLVADVPVGAFLSGGLDSTTIVSLASGLKQGISTYSFGFGDSINELPFAREAAAKYKTTHLELQAGAFDLAELFVEMQNIYDEPFADSSNIPTYLIAKLAREHTNIA